MRKVIWALAIATFACPSRAAGQEKPQPLTPEEARDGWIALFDGETTFGWKVQDQAGVEDGVLRVGGKKGGAVTTTTSFGRGLVKLRYRQSGEKKARMDWRAENRVLSGPGGGSWVTEEYEPGEGGRAPIVLFAPPGTVLEVDRILFRPLGLETIFNGKDLTGWKVFPGERYKSKFTVTKDGLLHVQNGPGDLQTEKRWKDFVLQLECKVNGEHLNSGIFFRAIPGQYQQGYEAQIRNQWQGDDRGKPVDFGTGAIYRRRAARKVLSDDKAWFTMTVVAHGNHIATWVNGCQVTDFTDERPEADNARKGTKLGEGVISIQGHDPTTDLYFRNIRVQELPAEK